MSTQAQRKALHADLRSELRVWSTLTDEELLERLRERRRLEVTTKNREATLAELVLDFVEKEFVP